jgi:hypothetical protein
MGAEVGMADIQKCWVRTAHEQHGWTEVDGKVHSLVDASTVLQVPPGSHVGYHHCIGVQDKRGDLGAGKLAGREYSRDYESIYTVSEYEARVDVLSRTKPSVVHSERRVTLDAVYERLVIYGEWREVQRITCFCCTCPDYGNDWACRNHNMGFGMRPCELHGVEGQREVDPETDEEGEMPESVQEYRKSHGE